MSRFLICKPLLLAFFIVFNSISSKAYVIPESGSAQVNMCSGEIFDMGGEYGPVSESTTSILTINPQGSGKKVVLRILEFDIDFYNDNFSIYNGSSASGTPLISLKGSKNESQLEKIGEFYSTASNGALTIKLETGKWSDKDGFKLQVICIDNSAPSYTITPNTFRTLQTCNSYLYDNGGPYNNYRVNTKDTLFILPTEDYKRIKLNVEYRSLNDGGGLTGQDNLTFLGGLSEDPNNFNVTSLGLYGYGFENLPLYSRRVSDSNWETTDDGGAWLRHTSNETLTDDGYRIKVSCINDPNARLPIIIPRNGNKTITTCNEEIYDNGGVSGPYQANSNGSLTITPANTNEVIKLLFNEFNVSQEDSLSIFEGTSTSGTLIGSYRGTQLPSEIQSSIKGQALTLQLRSNNSSEKSGFKILASCDAYVEPEKKTITMPGNGKKEVVTCNAIVTDNGGSGDYTPEGTGELLLIPEPGKGPIELTFTEFYTASNDVLEVYDGRYNYTNLNIGYFQNGDIMSNITATNSEGVIYLRFDTDASEAGFTFHVGCSTGDEPEELLLKTPITGSGSITTCDTLLFDDGGVENYSNNVDMIYTIYPDDDTKNVTIDLEDFQTDINGDDILKIYNGETDLGTELLSEFGYYTYREIDVPTVVSNDETGALTLKFSTNSTTTYRGFIARVGCKTKPPEQAVLIPKNGNITINTCDTTIMDDGGIENYSNYSDGGIIIFPNEENKLIKLRIEEFSTEYRYDGLYIYSGEDNASLLDDLNGSGFDMSEYVSADLETGAIYLKQYSDYSYTYPGFVLKVSCIDLPDTNYGLLPSTGKYTITTCDTILYDAGGLLNNYENNSDLELTFLPLENSGDVIVTLSKISIEEKYDSIKVFSGTLMEDLESFTGTYIPEFIFESDSVKVFLTSDNTITESGFKIAVSCSDLITNAFEFTEDKYALYPNPTNKNLNFIGKGTNYTIYSTKGEIMLNGIIINNSIDVSTLKNGFYLLKIDNNESYKFSKY